MQSTNVLMGTVILEQKWTLANLMPKREREMCVVDHQLYTIVSSGCGEKHPKCTNEEDC